MSLALRLQRTCAVLYLTSVALQVYMAGLALFGAASFTSHALFGYLMILGAGILVLLTALARLPSRVIVLSVLVLVAAIAQPVLALVAREKAPVLAALHPLNALIIFVLAARVGSSTVLPASVPPPTASY